MDVKRCAFTLIIVGMATLARTQDCVEPIKAGQIPFNFPVILLENNAGDITGFAEPNNEGNIVIPNNARVRFACTPDTVHINGFKNADFAGRTETRGTCVNTNFIIDQNTYVFRNDLECNVLPGSVAEFTEPKQICLEDPTGPAYIVNVGFKVGGAIQRSIEICFRDADKQTLWSKFSLSTAIGHKQKTGKSIFVPDSFYNGLTPSVQDSYKQAEQVKIFKNIFNNNAEDASSFIGNKYFLSRGHLAGKDDFVLNSFKKSTFRFVNMAPQWSTINSGNWQAVESKLQALVTGREAGFTVFTGTIGVLSLTGQNSGVTAPIYLSKDANDNNVLPVPKFVWKVVHDKVNKRGTAIISVNNPYEKDPAANGYVICAPVPLNWINDAKWKPMDVIKGYTYGCAVNDPKFRALVPSLPLLDVSNGLL